MGGITIALDLMGGDNGPRVTVPAAKLALNIYRDLDLLLFGEEKKVLPFLKAEHLVHNDRMCFVNSPDSIVLGDSLHDVLRHRKHSSLWMAIEAVQKKQALGAVSAGNTAHLVAISSHLLGTVPGIHRSALVRFLPSFSGPGTVFMDLGANLEADAKMLYRFALMGNAASKLCGIPSPRIAVLNVGTESTKGPQTVRDAAKLINADSRLNYVGFAEGTDLFANKADVIVTDGFTGNVALKTAEGLYRVVESRFGGNGGIWSFLAKPLKNYFKGRLGLMQPDAFNGSCLLGLSGVVVKSHGAALSPAMANAIGHACFEVRENMPAVIADSLISI